MPLLAQDPDPGLWPILAVFAGAIFVFSYYSLLSFAERRWRRALLHLFAMLACALVTVFGFFWLISDDVDAAVVKIYREEQRNMWEPKKR
jgi:nitrate reductase NapE component